MREDMSYPGYEEPVPDWVPRLSEADAQILFPDFKKPRDDAADAGQFLSGEPLSREALDSLTEALRTLRARKYR